MFTLAFVSAWLGLSTYDPELTVALVFPPVGTAVVWLATGRRETLPWDLTLLGAATLAGAFVAGVVWQAAAMSVVVTVAQGVVTVGVLSVAHRRRGRGAAQLTRLPDVALLALGCAVGAVASAALRAAGLGLLPLLPFDEFALTAARNLSWSFGLGAAGLLLLREDRGGIRAPRGLGPRWIVEGVLVTAATAWVFGLMFSEQPRALGFVLILAVLWTAIRTTPTVTVALALVLGVAGVAFTLARRSPFVASGDAFEGAVLAQVFLVSVVLAGLVLAVGTEERQLAVERAERAEREARSRATLLTAVLEHIDEGISVITPDDRYSVRNPAALRLSGQGGFLNPDADDPDSAVMLDEQGVPLSVDQMPHARALRSGTPVVREIVRVRQSDRERTLEVTSVPLLDQEDLLPVVVNTLRDITEAEAERDQLVSFAGVVAHDLKNPLTVIRGWSESLQEELAGEGSPDVATLRAMVARVVTASDSMRGFIDDLLGMTIARDRQLELEVLDLTAVAEEVAELRRTGETRPRITVQPGMRVTADRFLVRQLLDNLVGNAVKYVAPEVRPAVSVSAVEDDGMVEVVVSDNGIGIPPDQRERVFQPLVRADGASSYAGTGLGLAICRRVVERHGGRIWVDRGAVQGTTFRFTLPAVTAHD